MFIVKYIPRYLNEDKQNLLTMVIYIYIAVGR
jgi:hypothetical protein